MALADKRTPRKLIKGRTDGILDSEKITRASASMADDIFSRDPAYADGHVTPILYHADLMQEDIDELRRHIVNDRTKTDNNFTTPLKNKLDGIETNADVTNTTNVVASLTAGDNITIASDGTISSTASGGGLTETPLAMISGRWQWASTDSGERIHVGSSAYGPFNYYVFANEPVAIRGNTNLLRYDKRHSVNTTTAFIYPYYAQHMGIWCPDNGKKVKVKFSFRVQSAPANSTWGISLWDCNDPTSGTTTSTNTTVTLRAESADITATTNSTTYWTTTATTTNTVGDKWLLPMLENRSGTLTTNTYIYGQVALYLVD